MEWSDEWSEWYSKDILKQKAFSGKEIDGTKVYDSCTRTADSARVFDGWHHEKLS